MTCAELELLAPDLALGLALGPERSDAIEHLEMCTRCRALVDELSRAADDLLLLAPGAEPRRGFESRVLNRLAEASSGGSGAVGAAEVAVWRWRRRAVVATVAAVVAALALIGVVVADRSSSSGSAGKDLRAAPMVTTGGRPVGEVFLLQKEQPLVLLSLPGWSAWLEQLGVAGGEYRLRLEVADGGPTEVALPSLSAGGDAWGGAVPVRLDRLTRIAVVDAFGREVCGATLS